MDWQNTQDCEKSAHETAKIICECVNNWLTDIENIQKQLKSSTPDETPQSPQVVLQFLHHCIDVFPECYVQKKYCADADNKSKKEITEGFTTWVLGRLINILGYEECEPIYLKCLSVATSIIKLVQDRDIKFYKKLIKETVFLYRDILEASEHFQTSCENRAASPMYCYRFMDCKEEAHHVYGISPEVVSVVNYKHCRNLLKNLSLILKENIQFIQHCATDVASELPSLTVRTAALGDELLLKNTLDLMCSITDHTKPTQVYMFHQYINIVLAVLEWMIDEENDMELISSLKKMMIALVEANPLQDSSSSRFVNKLLHLIQGNQNQTLQDISLVVVARAIQQWPKLRFEPFSTNVIEMYIARISQHTLQEEVMEAFKCIIRHLTSSQHTSQNRSEEVWLMLKEKIKSYIDDLNNRDGKIDVKLSLLKILNFFIQFTVEELDGPRMKDFYTGIDLSIASGNLCSSLKEIQNTSAVTQLRIMYVGMISFLSNYVYIASFRSFSLDKTVFKYCVEICSIPWLSTIDPPWFDLTMYYFSENEIRSIATRLDAHLSSGKVQMKCLDLMILLFKDVKCHTWITHVMRNALTQSQSNVRDKLLQCLPQFMFLQRKYTKQSFEEDLLMFIRSSPTNIMPLVAIAMKHLVCIYSECVTPSHVSGKLVLSCSCCCCCCSCCLRAPDVLDGTSTKTKPKMSKNIVRNFKPYFQLLKQCTNTSFKYHIVSILTLLVQHFHETDDLAALWISVLDLLQDADYETRFSLCDVLAMLLKSVEERSYHQLTVDHISDTVFKANQMNDSLVLETVILAMGSVGAIAKDELCSAMLVSLFNCFVTQNQFLAALAADQIHGIARARKVTCHCLFLDHKSQLCDITVKKLHKDLDDGKDFNHVTNNFFSIAKLFEFSDVKTFLLETSTETLPKVVQHSSKNSSILLRLIAKYAQQNRREMLFYNFKYIFSYLLRTISNETQLEKCLQYLQEETDVELSILLLSEYQSVLNQLILYLSVNREQVYQGFSILASNDDNYTGLKELNSDQDVAVFLQHKLLGILAFFNTVLTSSPKYLKKVALKSILCLLEIMGKKYLTPVRLKVMAILKLTLKYNKEYLQLCCEAWYRFVQNIELECIGPLLGQIVATLLPMLESVPELVAVIFNFLIVENRIALKEYFKDIYFMPSHPMLNKVKSIIESNLTPVTTLNVFKQQLQSACKAINSENEEVRKFALIKICELLEGNTYLRQELVDVDHVDTCIKRLIHAIMQVTKESGQGVYGLVGRCFGILGAIDIGTVDSMLEACNDDNNNSPSISNMNSIFDGDAFAVDIINELCRSFLAASNTRAQDCAAFSIQETLRYYECASKTTESGDKLWSKFPESTQELLTPHLRSKYVNTSVYNWSKQSLPLYGSAKGLAYRDWTCSYTSYLIYHFTDDIKHSKLLKPFISVIKYDLRMALYLLPHVVLVTLTSGEARFICTEFTYIFSQAAALENVSECLSLCIQTLFSVFDFLVFWCRNNKSHESISDSQDSNVIKSRVTKFINEFPKDILASAALHCKSLSRSLLYYEEYISTSGKSVEKHLQVLQKIYYALDEPDGIAGIAATRTEIATLNEKIVEHESSGNLRSAVACFERAIITNAEEVTHHKGLLNCLITLGQLNNASMNVIGVIENRPDWQEQLQPFRAEVSWRLGQWDKLKDVVDTCEKSKQDWSISLGKLLLSLKFDEVDQFKQLLSVVRSEQGEILLNSSLGSSGYRQAYQSLLRLHMLQDMEVCSRFIFKQEQLNVDAANRIIGGWNKRMEVIESSYKTRESVLYLHQTLIEMLPSGITSEVLQKEKDMIWLKIAKIARKNGLFQTAYSALLNIEHVVQEDVVVEKANWYSNQKKLHEALQSLQEHSLTTSTKHRQDFLAKISLKKATLMEEMEYYDIEKVLAQYKDVVLKHQKWEKGHFYLAKYYDKLMNAVDETVKESNKARKNDFIKFVIKHYGTSLQYGNKYIYQSMPKLLTLWLDFGQSTHQICEGRSSDHKLSEKTYRKDKMQMLNEDITKLYKELPSYKFLTAVSQLVSRICHPNPSVWELLKAILCKIFMSYKQQAVWSLVAVSKSTVTMRSERCREIFRDISKSNKDFKQFITHSLELTDMLLSICNYRCGNKETKLSMKRDFPVLVRMLKSPSMSNIMVPLQETLTVKISTNAESQFNPFPDVQPYISSVDDCIEVLPSLQKPKKINVKASNGFMYTLMCKPKDDLRKDSRLMEFNSLVNKLLLQDPECRRRQLHIRTYAVIPLNEECGLLEWVQNTSGLRNILLKIYKEKKCVVKIPELRQMYDSMKNLSLARKVEYFNTQILPMFPAVFHEWFLQMFPTSTKWYTARVAYSRTSAVISMVGYVLGLGDRHGENILYDSTCGDCVHVDFNCLFNKGEKFDCPERVPFRLTNNMVKAMGALGYEGVFRKSCEHTMKVMRHERDSLLSVLNTFLHDPLVEWKKESRKITQGERSNDTVVKILRNVENRLKGYMRNHSMIDLSISIEGQVDQLIKEATNSENLAQMYIGWAAYL